MTLIEWDLEKNKANIRKHGVSFEDASCIFDDPYMLCWLDRSFEYGEDRWIALGAADFEIVLIVIHTIRGCENEEERIRIISAREPNKHEARRYSATYKKAARTLEEIV